MKNKILFVTYGSSNFNLQKKHIVNLAKILNFLMKQLVIVQEI